MGDYMGIAWENIVVGILGGVIVSVAFYLVSLIKNKVLERKYPIKGTYLTTFEDIENGKAVKTSALAELKQRGKKIKGKTFIGDDRTWILEGELTDTGNLHGVYFADDPLDKGVGNFFLKVANNKRMCGLWSGYDSENNIINSGKYSFIPVLSDYSVEDAEKEHITQIVAIGNKELGEGFLNYQEVMDMTLDTNAYICKVALSKNKVLGFCLCKIVPQDDLCNYLRVSNADLPKYINCADKIGVIKTIAVCDSFQGRGIGYALTFAGYNELSKRDIQAICSIAWTNDGVTNAKGVLSAVGLRPHNEIKSFWGNDSLEHGYNCPACGAPPCECSAILYFKAI
jgi:ribosomal protein S18 acetylase RimI-like enzyme